MHGPEEPQRGVKPKIFWQLCQRYSRSRLTSHRRHQYPACP